MLRVVACEYGNTENLRVTFEESDATWQGNAAPALPRETRLRWPWECVLDGLMELRVMVVMLLSTGCAQILGVRDLDEPVDATGTLSDAAPFSQLGPFADSGTTLMVPRQDHAAVLVGSKVYVLGGVTCGGCASDADVNGTTATVEVSATSTTGLGPFAETSGLLQPRQGPVAFHVRKGTGDWLYVVGGMRRPDAQSSGIYVVETERAPVAADGTIGAFANAPDANLGGFARASANVVVTADDVYLIGGRVSQTAFTDTIVRAPIDANGNVGAFQEYSTAGLLSSARARMAIVQFDAHVLLLGGETVSSESSSAVDMASVNGSVLSDAKSSGVRTLTALSGPSALAFGGKIWLFGGGVHGLSATDEIESASIVDGAVGSFVLEPERLDRKRSLAAPIALPDRYCLVGGSETTGEASVLATTTCAPYL